jgi:hypothetical protein
MTILLQDIYQVKGRSELPFEEALQDHFWTTGTDTPSRLALAAWVPHGGGEGYEFLTLIELANGDELTDYNRWTAGTDGVAWNALLQGMCYSQQSSLHTVRHGSLDPVRTETEALLADGTGRPPLYRLDRLTVPSPAEALTVVGGQLSDGPAALGGPILTPVAAWSPLLSVIDAPQISVLYRFSDDGFRRAYELNNAARPWDGEIDLDKVATARETRILRSARGTAAKSAG